MFDKILTSIGKFSYRSRYKVLAIALLFFVLVIFLQSQAKTIFLYFEDNEITGIFPDEDSLVIVYDNEDEDKIQTVIDELSKDENIISIQSYANTLGLRMNASDLSGTLGLDKTFADTLLYMYSGGTGTEEMTLHEFINFVASDEIIENEAVASMMDEETKDMLVMAREMINGIVEQKSYTPEELAELFGVDENMIKLIFYISVIVPVLYDVPTEEIQDAFDVLRDGEVALPEFSIAENQSTSIEDIFTSGIPSIDEWFPSELPSFEDISSSATGSLLEFFNTLTDQGSFPALPSLPSGNLSDILPPEKMTISEFTDTALTLSENFDGIIDDERLELIKTLSDICYFAEHDRTLTPSQLLSILPIESEMLNEETVSLVYLLHGSSSADLSDESVALYDLITFIKDSVLSDERFAPFLSEDMKSQISEAETMMNDGKAQLVGPDHSRMIVTLGYEFESEEINAFYENLTSRLDELFRNEYYLVGNSAMSYEVSESFSTEYLFISIITALAVFTVVCITFRKFSIPLLLICIIECAVFTMMSAMAISGTPIYFVAVIIVQCILMGSMIDYAILFSTYYREIRETYDVANALPVVLKTSIEAIATSSVVMIVVTFICGRFMTGAVSTILTALGIGALSALILVIFVLPSLLAIFDEVIVTKKSVPLRTEDSAVTDTEAPANR